MERLTNKKEADAQRGAYKKRLEQGYPRNIPEERFLRLAAYEDTGLEPEEIKKVFNEDAVVKLAAQALGTTPDCLRELVKARDEGRVVELPCKAGDAVYSLSWNIKTEQYDVRSGEVKNARYDSADDTVTVSDGEYLRVLGKTVFLTRTEAEAALSEGGREDVQ